MSAIVSKLKRKLRKTDTAERCGVILMDGTIVNADNLHPEPERGFILPAKLLVENEDDLYGTWHTHPHDTANLSQTDYAGFAQWPRLRHFIIGVDGVRCFKLEDGLIVEVDL